MPYANLMRLYPITKSNACVEATLQKCCINHLERLKSQLFGKASSRCHN